MPPPLERRLTATILEVHRTRPRWHVVAWAMACLLWTVVLYDLITFTP